MCLILTHYISRVAICLNIWCRIRARNVRIKGKPIELDEEYLVAVYGGPPLMGVQPEKENIREIVIDYYNIHADRKSNVKVLDHS